MTSVSEDAPRRLSSDERRAQILSAALAVFGAKGYVGTTTDDVARAASVSQPYVVRLFGTKEKLFLEVLDDAVEQLLATFRDVLAAGADDLEERMGDAYIDMLRVRGLHQLLSHAFLLGAHPVIGPAARACFLRVWRFLRDETHMDADAARAFLAEGMLLNTMIGLRLVDDADDAGVAELLRACFPPDTRAVLDVVPRGDEPW
ncbi:TetR/AcrR family transcriptional regulator [Microbacterium sp. 10M-3C3]|jgi:AcrR family transcriptional regulator|uniref:TetR/AcrR family transcriptional regulator n=1 Tax=Microbacterium sp. 10M-3C3 TaxID=2483401 RepID=UPI000F6361F1|nr:TetR/AcrR family transcriptional regulator [Microbacterium sp. 10M-3C3]